MSFGWGVGNITTISELAVKVYTAYKDAPANYRHISEEVIALKVLVGETKQYLESTTMSSDDRQNGLKVLKGCQSVFGDIDSLIEKYKSLAPPITRRLVFKRVKRGSEDIATLRARLTSNATLLSSFIRRFDHFYIAIEYKYIMLISKFLDANSLRCRHSRLALSAFTTPTQEFQ